MALWIDYAAAVSAAAQERASPHTPAASAVPTKLLRVMSISSPNAAGDACAVNDYVGHDNRRLPET